MVGMQTATAVRHPADPEPVPSTKTAAAMTLAVVAVITAPMIGGVVPALFALWLAAQAKADIVASEGFLLGASKLRRIRRLAYIALGIAALVLVFAIVWWVFGLARDAGGTDFAPEVD